MSTLGTVIIRSRPRFWLYLAGPVLVGLVFGSTGLDDLVSPLHLVLFLYFLLPANLYLYGVNDIFDADIDHHNPKKTGRERRYRGDRVTLLVTIGGLILGIAILPFVPAQAMMWFVGFFILAGAYSIPPLHLKRRPFLDSLSNGLYILPGVGAYVTVAGELPPVAIITGAWLWTMAMHTFSAIPDIQPDRRGGIQTTATVLGEQGAIVYCGVCWLIAAIAFMLVDIRGGLLLGVYPLLLSGWSIGAIDIYRAYWWYPAINAGIGMVLTIYGLWVITYG